MKSIALVSEAQNETPRLVSAKGFAARISEDRARKVATIVIRSLRDEMFAAHPDLGIEHVCAIIEDVARRL